MQVANLQCILTHKLHSVKLAGTGGQNASFDKKTLQRIQDLELLEENKKNTLFDLIDTYIRDAKTRQAYAG